MSNVISLDSKRIEKLSKQVAYKDGGTDIDFNDVERFCSFDEKGVPTLKLEDRIALGERARVQVEALFWRYALRQMPETWGELVGNWNYCRLMSMWLLGIRDETKGVVAGLRRRHNARRQRLGDIVCLLADGNIDAAHALHVELGFFRDNAVNPMLTKN